MVAELIATVALPAVALIQLTDADWLGPFWGLVVALIPPLLWALLSMVRERRVSALAVIAAGSVLLTGGVGLFELDTRWFALKEAAVPAALGLAAIVTAPTRYAVLPILLDRVLDADKVADALRAGGGEAAYDRLARRGTVMVGALMLTSALGTFCFALYMVQAPAGTEAFGEELGRYTALSFPVVGIPATLAMAWVLRGVLIALEELTGGDLEALMRK